MILFLGSTEISQKVLEAISKKYESLVITKPGCEVQSFCERNNLPFFTVKTLRNFSMDTLNGLVFKFLVTVDFGLLVPKSFLSLPEIAPVNIHASLLPKFRGAAPLQWAILSGENQTGISYMKMDEGLDTGCVYKQIAVPLDDSITYTDLRGIIAELSSKTVVETLTEIEEGKLDCVAQEESLATYAPKITAELERLKITNVFRTLRHINALSLKPGAYIDLNGRRLKILRAIVATGLDGGEPMLFNVKNSLYLRCSDGCLKVTLCQFEGGKIITGEDLVNGFRGKLRYDIKSQ